MFSFSFFSVPNEPSSVRTTRSHPTNETNQQAPVAAEKSQDGMGTSSLQKPDEKNQQDQVQSLSTRPVFGAEPSAKSADGQTTKEPSSNEEKKSYADATKNGNGSEQTTNPKPASRPSQQQPKSLKPFEDKPKATGDASTLKVTFQVLLPRQLTFEGSELVVVPGKPLSDWETVVVVMRPVEVVAGGDGESYTLMVGEAQVDRSFVGKTIPYKYVIKKKNGDLVWEFVHSSSGNELANRCLIIPDVDEFTKFDDVVLRDTCDFYLSLRKGRDVAAHVMIPQPSVVCYDPNFDFAAALATLQRVMVAFNEKKVCYGNRSISVFSGSFDAREHVEKHYRNSFNALERLLKDGGADHGKILRLALYIVLVRYRWRDVRMTLMTDAFVLFEAFRLCTDLLAEDAALPACVNSDFQCEVAQLLKELVLAFLGEVRKYEPQREDMGHWVYAVPFIHRWDHPDARDSDWLKLREWKNGLDRYK